MPLKTFDRDRVSVAFNAAADDIADALDLPDEGKRDLLNLLINVGMHYLDWPDGSLSDAIEANYGDDAPSVLDWSRR